MKLKRKFLHQLLRQALHYSVKKKLSLFQTFCQIAWYWKLHKCVVKQYLANMTRTLDDRYIAVNRTRPCLIRATSALSLHKSWINARFEGATYGDNQDILCSILLILWTMLYSGIKIICIVCS